MSPKPHSSAVRPPFRVLALAVALSLGLMAGGNPAPAGSSPEASGPRIVPVSGDDQRAPPGEPLAEPLVVRVLDGDGAPLSGHSVTFSKEYRGPHNARLDPEAAETNGSGEATTVLTLGEEPGNRPPRTYEVRAEAEGAAVGNPVRFTARAVREGEEGDEEDDDENGEPPNEPEPSRVHVLVTVSDTDPAPGAHLEVTVRALNLAFVAVEDVAVRVELPEAHLELVEHEPSQGSYEPGDGLWRIGRLGPAQGARLVATAVLRPTGRDP